MFQRGRVILTDADFHLADEIKIKLTLSVLCLCCCVALLCILCLWLLLQINTVSAGNNDGAIPSSLYRETADRRCLSSAEVRLHLEQGLKMQRIQAGQGAEASRGSYRCFFGCFVFVQTIKQSCHLRPHYLP